MNKLSKERYLELKYFCRQYSKKKTIQNNNTAAGRRAKCDVNLIEEIVKRKAKGFEQQMLRNITMGTPWEALNAPCGRRKFYETRKKIFIGIAEFR
ncbi:hypothetical protein [uncultured Eubacterium sp.]|mgnify:CR=1 FL=1|uniref:hypothetical protein n=1 Tax=uncultured Eubacterium sp. TaxID=165185 RepID=UPI002673559A|nr:hypothetical protein [uncultured Eubacterium sp.]